LRYDGLETQRHAERIIMGEDQSNREPKRRFSSRVSYYVNHRPGYPADMLEYLKQAAGLNGDTIIGDIGSGTGLLAELFLQSGCVVYGVEPNPDMRAAGERCLRKYPRFHSIDGAAEETTLPNSSVDLITAGQAFHWFDVEAARREFIRILRPGGSVVLVWNSPRSDAGAFMRAYRTMRDNVPDARDPAPTPTQANAPPRLGKAHLFGSTGFESRSFANQQEFDWEGLKGRTLSESGAPLPDDPRYPAMIAELERAFAAHEEHGRVVFPYDTEVYWGRIGALAPNDCPIKEAI
jgi:SAM-dependent methyltransferase